MTLIRIHRDFTSSAVEVLVALLYRCFVCADMSELPMYEYVSGSPGLYSTLPAQLEITFASVSHYSVVSPLTQYRVISNASTFSARLAHPMSSSLLQLHLQMPPPTHHRLHLHPLFAPIFHLHPFPITSAPSTPRHIASRHVTTASRFGPHRGSGRTSMTHSYPKQRYSGWWGRGLEGCDECEKEGNGAGGLMSVN